MARPKNKGRPDVPEGVQDTHKLFHQELRPMTDFIRIREDTASEFTCARCGQVKKAKLRYQYSSNGEARYICNACYGNLMSSPAGPSTAQSADNISFTSLCAVSSDKWLMRLADIKDDALVLPAIDAGAPFMFENRTKLFRKDGPDTAGAFGVWEWSAVPNLNDPSKDYVETHYRDDIEAAEIIHIAGASTPEEAAESLKDGIAAQPVSRKVLFCTRRNGASFYEGVLCTEKDTSINGGITHINETVPGLPVYSFRAEDELELGGKTFCRNISLGPPVRRVMLMNINSIIRDAVRRKISWSAAKVIGLQKRDWQKIADFIENMQEQSLVQEVAGICSCSEEEAGQYIHSFIEQAGQYISCEDYDSGVMAWIIENNDALMKKCTGIVKEQLHAETSAAREEMARLQEAVDEKQKVLPVLEAKLSALKKDIQAHEKLSREVGENVRKRISEARSDAAAFIAEMAFARPEAIGTAECAVVPGTEIAPKNIETVSGWKVLAAVLADNLAEAGVAEEYTDIFAAFMYSAYVHKTPLLLAGPLGMDIADAFSAAVSGRTAGVVDCSGKYYAGVSEDIAGCSDEVFALKNALRNEWAEHIPEIIAGGKDFFVVHPYTEDLLIEPKSLFSYVMPVFTELIAGEKPSREYTGTARAENFAGFSITARKPLHNAIMKSIGLSRYARGMLQAVLTDFREMYKPENDDAERLFVLFPYAYIFGGGAVDEVLGSIASSELKDELEGFAGVAQ